MKKNELISMDSKEYRNIHDWLRRHKKGDTCEHCKSKDKKLDNALISGKSHKRDTDNYIKLCRKCHINYDKPNGVTHTDEAKKRIGEAQRGKKLTQEHIQKLIDSKKGIPLTDSHKEKISKGVRGENHNKAKLKEGDINHIRCSDLTTKELADIYNVTTVTITNVKSKRTWSHVD